MLPILAERQLVVVTGKGGVGKSTVAAVLGRFLAAMGRRTLVLEIDPRESVHQLLGTPPSGGAIRDAAPRLGLQNLRARQVLDQLVRERLRVPLLAGRVLSSPVYDHFATGAPGLEEVAVLGHVLRLLGGQTPGAPPIDVVILDAPASGHGASLLSAPRLVAAAIDKGPIGRLTARVADLVDGERTAVVVVTEAEEMPVTEALELRALMKARLGREPEMLVANSLYPPLPPAVEEASRPHSLWDDRRRLNERQLARLCRGWRSPDLELPLLPLGRGPKLVGELSRYLGRFGERE